MTVFRYQDNEGRGPFKPGMTERWLVDHESKPKGLIQRIGPHGVRFAINCFVRKHAEIHNLGFGCATIDGLFRWFTREERIMLHGFGYRMVAMQVDGIVAENDDEIIFARRMPLSRRAVRLFIE